MLVEQEEEAAVLRGHASFIQACTPPPSEITVHRKSVPKPRGCCINSPHSLKSAAEEAGGEVPPAETAPVTELTYQIRKTDSDKD